MFRLGFVIWIEVWVLGKVFYKEEIVYVKVLKFFGRFRDYWKVVVVERLVGDGGVGV